MFNRYDIPLFIGMACAAVAIELVLDPTAEVRPFVAMALTAVVVSVRFIWEELRQQGSVDLWSSRRRRRRSRRGGRTTES